MFNGATVHGFRGIRELRHPAEIPLLIATSVATALAYLLWIALVIWLVAVPEPTGPGAQVRDFFLSEKSSGVQFLLLVPIIPIILWVVRAMLYAKLRATAVQMSPTQFPEGYRMVVEAAQQFGLRRVPDAYVTMGNGRINAFASGHGYRRFVAVHSDMFEIGGQARDPEALRFVIGHEVGHLAAGHISLLRLLFVTLGRSVPLLGNALSRAQEYTADNHGYAYAPEGVPGVMGVLSGGKYLGAEVNTHALADRATREKGLWLHVSVWRSTHPVVTWRAHALRDRSRPGRIMIRPPESTAWFPPSAPSGSGWSGSWPTPEQMLAALDSTSSAVPSEEQFGRYPGVAYEPPRNELRWASLVPVPVGTAALGQAAFTAPPNAAGSFGSQQPDPYGYTPSADTVSGPTGVSDTAGPNTSAPQWPGDGPDQD
ncbi:M48 family metallopeptidase [Actinomyces oris]|uniref:Peptidase M48 n=1 Tax=Actinomyces oris TaxID=544580 RepID=A0A1Q8I3Q3_9ACTO|nr:M48 family metallopeptidase [Actinomyces oris]OLL15733.1 peptidase M48 [Actinomyces oris]